MKRMISFVLAAMFVVLSMVVPSEAQARYRGNWYQLEQEARCAEDPYCAKYLYGSGNIYNPYRWQMQNFGGGYGQLMRYPYDPYQGYYGRIIQNAGGNPYFDAYIVPCQVAENSQRWQKGIGITAIGAVAGAIIGGANGHAGKGAIGGAGVGAAIAVLNNSRYCKASQSIQLPIQPDGQPVSEMPVPSQEQAPTSIRPVAGPATNTGEGEFTLSNSSRFRTEVYYDGKYIGRLDHGASMRVDYPEKDKKYSAYLLVPNEEGGISSLMARRIPGDNGLTFSEPETTQGR